MQPLSSKAVRVQPQRQHLPDQSNVEGVKSVELHHEPVLTNKQVFKTPSSHPLRLSDATLNALKLGIMQHLDEDNIHVHVYTRM